MDFKQLISVASMKQKTKEKELATTKVGIDTRVNSKASTLATKKKKVEDEKQKKLASIMARVEAQSKKPKKEEKKPVTFNDTIMDFTGTGLSENDVRRRKLTEKEMAKKRAEFALKAKHLKENPIRPEEEEDTIPVKTDKSGHSSKSDTTEKHSSPNHEIGKSYDLKKDKNQDIGEKKYKHKTSKDRHKNSKHSNDKHSSDKHSSDKHSSDKHSSDKHKRSDKHKHKPLPAVEADIVSVAVKKPAPPAPAKKKNKPVSAPPPMSFAALLSVATQNKNNPSAILEAAKPVVKEKVKDKTPGPKKRGRPMTQEEKDRMERKKSAEYQRWVQHGGPRPTSCPPPRVHARPTSQELVSDSSSDEEPSPPPRSRPQSASQPIVHPKRAPGLVVPGSIDHKPKYQKSKSIFVPHSKEQRELALAKAGYSTGSLTNGDRPGQHSQGKNKATPVKNGDTNNHSRKPVNAPSLQRDTHLKVKSTSKSQTAPNSEIGSKTHKDSLRNAEAKKLPSAERKEMKSSAQGRYRPIKNEPTMSSQKARAPPEPAVNPWDRIYGQIQKDHPKPERNKRKANVIDSESEYDSELDDFIADDDEFIDDSGAGDDYSRHIQEIFRYDKRKYRDVDEGDISDMEAGYEQLMKEEAHSAKIGLLEDLEDMKMEEEENRRKMLLKKAKKLKVR